jgi:hypothetical protein
MRRERRTRIKKERQSKPLIASLFLGGFVFLCVSIFIFIYYKVSTLDKFIFVNKTNNGGGEVIVVDSNSDKVIKYQINPDTVLVSARGYGEYKLESLWILGQKEGLNGKLVAESVTTNFLSPVHLWKNGDKSNLNIFQKIKIKSLRTDEISPDKTLDTFNLSNSVLINFINNDIQEKNISVEVEDLTGDQSTINKVSAIIGTLGTKVSGYNKGYDENVDCEISGSDKATINVFADIFDCNIVNNPETNGVKLKLGVKFADRF